MAGLAHHAEIAAGIVVENHADVLPAFVVLFDAFDDCDLAAQGEVEDVAALFWDAGGRGLRPAPRLRRCRRGRSGFCLRADSIPIRSSCASFNGVRPRRTPCSFMNCSSGMFSVRSRILARAIVGLAHLALLLIGKGENAQRKDFVDLG